MFRVFRLRPRPYRAQARACAYSSYHRYRSPIILKGPSIPFLTSSPHPTISPTPPYPTWRVLLLAVDGSSGLICWAVTQSPTHTISSSSMGDIHGHVLTPSFELLCHNFTSIIWITCTSSVYSSCVFSHTSSVLQASRVLGPGCHQVRCCQLCQ